MIKMRLQQIFNLGTIMTIFSPAALALYLVYIGLWWLSIIFVAWYVALLVLISMVINKMLYNMVIYIKNSPGNNNATTGDKTDNENTQNIAVYMFA